MIFKIENTGILQSASVKLNGLTLIAGENDTGKSTVGKLLFSIIKAVSRYEQDVIGSKEKTIFRKIERLYFDIRRIDVVVDFEAVKKEFFPPYFSRQIKPYIEQAQLGLFQSEDTATPILSIFEEKQLLLQSLLKTELRESQFSHFEKLLTEIKNDLLYKENKETSISKAFQMALNSEFYGEVSPKNDAKESVISYSEGKNEILRVSIESNKIKSFSLKDVLPFNDVTFIETPLLLQMYDLIESAGTLFDLDNSKNRQFNRPTISFHIKDLISKLKTAAYYPNFTSEIHSQIASIIKGDFVFDRDEHNFLFAKKVDSKTLNIKALNAASGIKSFGIFQLLLQSNIINDQSLLIIDEPENHLHPKWQVEYARLIVELVKANIPVLISSHSPYMIQAINHFSEKEKITDRVNYYLAETNTDDGSASIDDVTDDLNRIFVKLAEPLHKLVWK